jgi:putative membrane protein
MKLTIGNKFVFALGIASIATLAFADGNLPATNQSLTALTSQQFVSDAAVSGMKEVFLGEMALATSTNAGLMDFASHMVKDHSAANRKLMKIAEAEGLNFPPTNTFSADDPNWSNPLVTNPESVKGAQLLAMTNFPYAADYQDIKRLQSFTGGQFDQTYSSGMVSDHIQAVNEFETASQTLSDPKLKKFAGKTLPTLRKHLKMAQDLNSQYNAPNGTNTTSQSSPM